MFHSIFYLLLSRTSIDIPEENAIV